MAQKSLHPSQESKCRREFYVLSAKKRRKVSKVAKVNFQGLNTHVARAEGIGERKPRARTYQERRDREEREACVLRGRLGHGDKYLLRGKVRSGRRQRQQTQNVGVMVCGDAGRRVARSSHGFQRGMRDGSECARSVVQTRWQGTLNGHEIAPIRYALHVYYRRCSHLFKYAFR